MTTYEHLMLSVCFGVAGGFVLFGYGLLFYNLFSFIKKKIKSYREKKNSDVTNDNE